MTRVLVLLALLASGPAAAHAILMDSTPAAGAALPPGPLDVALRFNSRVDPARSTAWVRRGPDQTALHVRPGADADQLAATGPTLAPGAYVLRWQVLAVDGHVTRGDVPFTVRAP